MYDFNIKTPLPPNTEIWIAEDVKYVCRANYNWFNRLMIRLVFGWKVKSLLK